MHKGSKGYVCVYLGLYMYIHVRRECESGRARDRESERARARASERVRERARERESERARGASCIKPISERLVNCVTMCCTSRQSR